MTGWARACFHGSLRRTVIRRRPGIRSGSTSIRPDRDHLQLAEPLGDLAGIDLAGALPGAAGVDQHGVAEQGLVVGSSRCEPCRPRSGASRCQAVFCSRQAAASSLRALAARTAS